MASFSASSSLSSGIFTLHIFFFDLGSLICPDIASKLGHRSTTFAALVTAFFSFVLLALCDGLEVIFVSYGVVLALSGGILFNVTLLMVPMYFEKHRRPALSCISVGMGASGVISPHLVRYLIDFYGYSGGLLLYGACFLQGCVLVVLVRPAPKPIVEVPEDAEYEDLSLVDDVAKKCMTMRNERVLLMSITRGFFHTSYFNFYVFLPFTLENEGYSPQFSAQCISNSSIMSTLVRIVVTLTVNHQRFPRKTALCAASVIAGILDLGFSFSLVDESALTGLCVLHGLGIGLFFSVFYASLIDIVGLPLYPASLAVNAIFLGITDTLISPILGVIRDFSGSYSAVLGTCAALKMCSAISLVILFIRMKARQN
ncbi:monocarboxylate transporter 3-like [Hyalella azteca]|uniref:Monocarboxylate transporter 3-like n=1 Tax=Hyalella azteca TaxID=294128 RepID=A0A979FR24_HYAAZ|nr:monocarboxylate transporter 3-like [Hyalella azteca]